MQAKLTLELDEHLIRRAERAAEASGRSVSDLIAEYLAGLEQDFDEAALPPITRALSGILEGADLDESEYYRHLVRKHA